MTMDRFLRLSYFTMLYHYLRERMNLSWVGFWCKDSFKLKTFNLILFYTYSFSKVKNTKIHQKKIYDEEGKWRGRSQDIKKSLGLLRFKHFLLRLLPIKFLYLNYDHFVLIKLIYKHYLLYKVFEEIY